jgi:hypothetical protein
MTDFGSACRDYQYLLDRGYPETGSVKLVGDRYRLAKNDRNILYRGVSSNQTSQIRREKLVHGISGDVVLLIDGHNVLFTIVNYLTGHPVFLGA